MGWRYPHSGWVFSLSFASLETPSQTRPTARLLRDSRSNQVDSEDGVRTESVDAAASSQEHYRGCAWPVSVCPSEAT